MQESPNTHQADTLMFPELHKWREAFLHNVLLGAVILGLLALITTLLDSPDVALGLVYGTAYLIVVAAAFIRMPYLVKARILLFLLFVVGVQSLLAFGIGGSCRLYFLTLIVFGGLLISARASGYMFILSLATIIVLGWLTLAGVIASPVAEDLGAWISSGATFLLLSMTILIGLNSFQREFNRAQERSAVAISSLQMERAHLEGSVALRTQELEQKTNHLRASTSIARVSSQIEDINELMDTVVGMTAERFNLSHVGIFLLDQRKKMAFLQAASSETGKELMARGFQLEVNRRNVIGVVIEQARSHLVSNPSDPFGRDVEFPQTRSRLLLPLVARGQVIGLMDLHSDLEQAFIQEDTEILQGLVDLIAVSIENVHLLNDMRALVTQLETLTSYQSQDAWQKYASRRAPSYQFTPSGVRPLFAPSENQSASGLQIPLLLRGKAIGTIVLRRKDTANWTERERALVEKIATQVALALDNSRLVEEAQRNAQRDQLIANVSSRVRETLDVESVIRTAALELRRIFDLKEAEVSVGSLTNPTVPEAETLTGKATR